MKMSKIPQGFFLVYGLILTNLWVAGYTLFVHYFQSGHEYQFQIKQLESQVEKLQENQKNLLTQLMDFKQTVAEVMPAKSQMIAEKWNPKAISLSENIRRPASIQPVDLSGVYFEKGKRFFNEGKYSLALREFQELSEKFPLSDKFIETQFLTLESSYLTKDYKKVVDLADFLVNHYPENILTGYAMLRLAQVSESNSQFEEALVIYQSVQKSFKDKDLQRQARELEKRIKFE